MYDSCYKLLHELHPVDDFIYLKKSTYTGEERIFADGTRLQKGGPVGIIHINNNCLADLRRSGLENERRAAWVFGVRLIESLKNLSEQLVENPSLRELTVITGITWFKPHGKKLGFEIEPVAEGTQKKLLRLHFQLLLYALFPQLAKRESKRLEPHQFWITRFRLINSMQAGDNYVARRLSKYNNPGIAV